MNEVLMINGERYRKCHYINECLEKLQPKGEVVEIYSVNPLYTKTGAMLGLMFTIPPLTRFFPGMKIRITVEE
jgi:hypothetical protein